MSERQLLHPPELQIHKVRRGKRKMTALVLEMLHVGLKILGMRSTLAHLAAEAVPGTNRHDSIHHLKVGAKKSSCFWLVFLTTVSPLWCKTKRGDCCSASAKATHTPRTAKTQICK